MQALQKHLTEWLREVLDQQLPVEWMFMWMNFKNMVEVW